MFHTLLLTLLISSSVTGSYNDIKIDGLIDKEEWKGATIYDLSAGGQVYILQQGKEVYIGIKGTVPGWAHVYLQSNAAVNILHASAALGSQSYSKGPTNWELQKKFSWELRDNIYNDALRQKQDTYFAANGWVANNNRMGDKISFEYRIDLQKFAAPLSFAVLVTADAKNISYYPSTIKDDVLLEELVRGNSPVETKFNISGWAKFNSN